MILEMKSQLGVLLLLQLQCLQLQLHCYSYCDIHVSTVPDPQQHHN
jgi:hypothetical protein